MLVQVFPGRILQRIFILLDIYYLLSQGNAIYLYMLGISKNSTY